MNAALVAVIEDDYARRHRRHRYREEKPFTAKDMRYLIGGFVAFIGGWAAFIALLYATK